MVVNQFSTLKRLMSLHMLLYYIRYLETPEISLTLGESYVTMTKIDYKALCIIN